MREDEQDGPPTLDADSFALLSDETRQDIVLETARLMEGDDRTGPSFTEVREEAGVVDPGRFRYHADKLTGTLLAKEDGEFIPRYGTLRRATRLSVCEPEENGFRGAPTTGFECPHCTRRTTFIRRESEVAMFGCGEHGIVLYQHLPSALDTEDPATWVDFALRTLHHDIEMTDIGLCPWCQREVRSEQRCGRFTYTPEVDTPPEETPLWVSHECDNCPYWIWYRSGLQATTDADVRAFFARHDIDVRVRPFPHAHVVDVEVLREDEKRREARFTYAIDGDHLTVTMDTTADVTDVERGRIDT